jgi:ArsR family transcriptional regulator, arsenate/arsenite/antimonite-responsive transcriptional repressor
MPSYAPLFAALADENRLRLLHLMRDGEICVCFLQGSLQTNQPKISRHLAYLRRSGLVQARRHGKWIYYSIKKQPKKVQPLLLDVLKLLSEQPSFQRDLQRARRIQCTPARFGLSSPQEPA